MQNRYGNSAESFQLLQLSDDSKSLSELELPEIVTKRKRKIRRLEQYIHLFAQWQWKKSPLAFTNNKKNNCFSLWAIRKVRSSSNQRFNQQQTNEADKLQCRYVSIWMCAIISCAWLFLLSYIVAIIHAEHYRLTKDIEHRKYFFLLHSLLRDFTHQRKQ